MYPVTSAYTEAIQAVLRDMRNITVEVAGVSFHNQSVRGLTLRECVSENADRLLPGCASCASIETTVIGALPESMIDAEMTASAGIVLADGSVFMIPLGVFVVKDITRQPGTYVTHITGYDRMSLLDGTDFTERTDVGGEASVPTWMTFRTLLNSIVPFDNSGDIKWATVPDVSDSYVINRPLDELRGYSCKELLGYIAGAHGKFARFTRDGLLEFAWYKETDRVIPTKAIGIGGLTLRARNDVTDTVTLYSNDDIHTSGYGDYTNDLISRNYAAHAGIVTSTVCTPGSLEYRGDPAIQAGDIVTVVYRDGTTRRFAISEHMLKFSGGLSGSAESHGSEYHSFHRLNSTQRDIARLKRNYSSMVEEVTE